MKTNIREIKHSLQDYKNIVSVQNQPSIAAVKRHFGHLSNQSINSSISHKPLQPTLFSQKGKKENKGQIQLDLNRKTYVKTHTQIQLDHHRIRKQAQSQHNKTINQFYKRKKFIARIMNKQDQIKIKRNQIQNRMEQCQKNVAIYQRGSLHTFLSKDTSNSAYGQNKNCSQYMLSSKIANRQKILAQLTQSYVSSAINLKNVNLLHQNQLRNHKLKIGNNTLSRRQVYLSNISNLEELRHSISHSRAKFHKKFIKMEREIGKNYIPFEDRVIGEENDVKGIFL